MDRALIAYDPADRVKPPKPDRKEFKVLSPQEAARFLEAAGRSRYRAFFVLATSTGMRLSELLGLRWTDSDFEAGVVCGRRTLFHLGRGRWVLGEPKTARWPGWFSTFCGNIAGPSLRPGCGPGWAGGPGSGGWFYGFLGRAAPPPGDPSGAQGDPPPGRTSADQVPRPETFPRQDPAGPG